jgi:molybdopterin converting factor small subunit
MTKIIFTIPSVLNQGGGEKKVDLESTSLQEAFSKIAEIMGDDFKRRVLEGDGSPRSLINIYVNGKNAKFSGGLETKLNDGDEVYILPAVAGGSDELSSKELDRFSRQVMLEEIGYGGQLKLKNAKICVVGVGLETQLLQD